MTRNRKVELDGDVDIETVTKAVVVNGIVTNMIVVAKNNSDVIIQGAALVDVTDNCTIGDLYEDGKFTRPKPTTDQLYQCLKDRRKSFEAGGIDFKGFTIATDRESQSMIQGAHNFVLENPREEIKYKTGSGFISLDVSAVKSIANNVAKHVQNAFKIEAEGQTKIASGQITTFAEIDELFKPKEIENASIEENSRRN